MIKFRYDTVFDVSCLLLAVLWLGLGIAGLFGMFGADAWTSLVLAGWILLFNMERAETARLKAGLDLIDKKLDEIDEEFDQVVASAKAWHEVAAIATSEAKGISYEAALKYLNPELGDEEAEALLAEAQRDNEERRADEEPKAVH